MSIDSNTVKKVAKLARIRLEEAEVEQFGREINSILKWVEQLQEINTDNVPPLASVADVALPWRADTVTDGNLQAQVLKNAPGSDYGCFLVPKVIE